MIDAFRLMKEFCYQVINKEGRKIRGSLSAQNIKEARDLLRLQGFFLLKIRNNHPLFSKKSSKNFLLTFSLQLKQLLQAGIPVYESLITMKEQAEDKDEIALILAIKEKIRKGETFSSAIACFPNFFDTRYVAMCKSGEMSGSLLTSINELAISLEKQKELKKKISSALLYPSMLFTVCVFVVGLLLLYVVPSIEMLLDGKKASFITMSVIFLSKLFQDMGLFIFLGFFAAASFLFFKKDRLLKSKKAYAFYLKIPFFKSLIIKTKLAHFFRTLVTLQKGGVAIIDSLELAKDVIHCPPLQEVIESAKQKIIQGSTLALELKKSQLIPFFVHQMLSIAQETGSLIFSFEKIAEFYEKDAEKALERLTIILQPMILVFMAFIIGFIMVALLLPLTDVSIWLGE